LANTSAASQHPPLMPVGLSRLRAMTLPSTLDLQSSEDSNAPEGAQSQAVKNCRDDAPAFVPNTTMQEPLPEICRNLGGYAQPHAAQRPPLDSAVSCADVWRREVSQSVANHPRIDG
jgi:hypothetical protein